MAKRKKSAPDYRLTIRLSAKERAGVRQAAKSAKLPEGAYIRSLLGRGKRTGNRGRPLTRSGGPVKIAAPQVDKAG